MTTEKTKKPKMLVEACKGYDSSNTHKFTGRLVGIINAEECQAIVNTPDIARRIYSLPTLNLEEDLLVEPWRDRKRLVIATDDFHGDQPLCRAVFISQVITWSYEATFGLCISCHDHYEYKLSTK